MVMMFDEWLKSTDWRGNAADAWRAAWEEATLAERNRCAKLAGEAYAHRPDGTYCDNLGEEILKGDTSGSN